MRIKSPARLIVCLVTIFIVLWMCYNFVIALCTGQKFSILGNPIGSGITNLVVAGVDEDGYRTDLILLCQFNRRDNKLSVLQIPRDTKVQNRRTDKKINSAYYSGFDTLSDEIQQVTGIQADRYVMVSFSAFRDIVDAVGGVIMDVPIRMAYEDPTQDLVIDLKPGRQRLHGEEAEMYMRYRSSYSQGDIGRLGAQQELYEAISKKMFSPIGVLRMPSVFFAVSKHTDTNLKKGKILSLMRDALVIGRENVEILTLPGEGKYVGGGSYFVPYKNQTADLIEEHFVLN
ncbi:MAG: LCP family protein [Clostridia bacterium]|nr:LCP family protein [Clostridia bacterium]